MSYHLAPGGAHKVHIAVDEGPHQQAVEQVGRGDGKHVGPGVRLGVHEEEDEGHAGDSGAEVAHHGNAKLLASVEQPGDVDDRANDPLSPDEAERQVLGAQCQAVEEVEGNHRATRDKVHGHAIPEDVGPACAVITTLGDGTDAIVSDA